MANKIITKKGTVVQDPPLARFLFSDTRMAIVWLVARVWLGWQWLESGWGKLQEASWMETGASLQGYWERAVAIPEAGRPAISFDFYRDFLQGMLDAGAYTWFAKVIVFGEILIGVALILGLFTGIAAFFGAFMNWNFIMAGSASSNGLMIVIAIALVLAWKIAGHYGLDRWVLPTIGTPWRNPKATDDLTTATTAPNPA